MIGERDRPGRRAVRLAPPFPSYLHNDKRSTHVSFVSPVGDVFGGTPNTACETHALPESTLLVLIFPVKFSQIKRN